MSAMAWFIQSPYEDESVNLPSPTLMEISQTVAALPRNKPFVGATSLAVLYGNSPDPSTTSPSPDGGGVSRGDS